MSHDDRTFRIRFHGRGGQGVKTASRVLGSALFEEGYDVQDAPRYGAERRGAPIFAYVRASRRPIVERGVITRPDLVVVVDDSVVPIPSAGVVAGLRPETVLLLHSADDEATWRERLGVSCPLVVLSPVADLPAHLGGTRCVGVAARMLGVVGREALAAALRHELGGLGEASLGRNLELALDAYDRAPPTRVEAGPPADANDYPSPDWIVPVAEDAALSAPAIHAAKTSAHAPTGLWRTQRPVVDHARCRRCAWLCGAYCPDGAVQVDAEGYPVIDYEHCKGCMVCAAQCPHHAIQIHTEDRAGGAP